MQGCYQWLWWHCIEISRVGMCSALAERVCDVLMLLPEIIAYKLWSTQYHDTCRLLLQYHNREKTVSVREIRRRISSWRCQHWSRCASEEVLSETVADLENYSDFIRRWRWPESNDPLVSSEWKKRDDWNVKIRTRLTHKNASSSTNLVASLMFQEREEEEFSFGTRASAFKPYSPSCEPLKARQKNLF